MKYLFLIAGLLILPLGAYGNQAEQQSEVTRNDMEQVLTDYLQESSARLPHVDLQLESASYPRSFTIPKGQTEYQLIPSKPGIIGSSRITLMTRVDGQLVSNQSIRVQLEAMGKVAVAAEALRRGTILGADDIVLRYQDISRLEQPLFDIAEAVGKKLKRSVRLGDPIERHQVEFPALVKRGEQVMIRASGAGMVLTAAGEARQDGRIGETIQVRNSNSRKEILCQVIAPGLVKVEF